MTGGGDNYTRVLSTLALHFENVNVNVRGDDGHFAMSADAKNVKMEGLEALHETAEETGCIYHIQGGQMLVLGQGIAH